ncbi:class I SAM-dependent methyltransferase [Amycolatopsis sp. EV170708-02-1]|uniref:class I SAM-dependent DNA methyltransferase n=1 Tax=Amycolatopsis sp. EV170708-02-1 TaxID=2919322 RepID=UPI001F0C91B2|nr:class I SAM-dependent methyltransferase [Amycolatopsis sp. EV170708-02-1]UMP04484.1 methyltransferase domain-containing protein [Amycolatopsis sp. EV170708-02-1]
MDRPVTAAELFDAIGSDYEEVFGRAPVVDRAVRHLLGALPPSSRVLDIGSGTGKPVAEDLSSAGHRVTGLDVSPVMIDIAREQVPAATFVHADVREWTSPPESWEAVCAFFPFLQMPREDTEAVLADIARWLVPGGLFALATVPRDVEDASAEFFGRSFLVTSFAPDDLVRRVEAVGLEVTGTHSEIFTADEPGTPPEEHLLITARRPA